MIIKALYCRINIFVSLYTSFSTSKYYFCYKTRYRPLYMFLDLDTQVSFTMWGVGLWSIPRTMIYSPMDPIYDNEKIINTHRFVHKSEIDPPHCYSKAFLKTKLQWQVTILWNHWYSLFWTSVDSAHGFQSQGGSIITHALLLLVHNDPQSQLWLLRSRPGPNFTPWYGEATAGVTAQCHFWDDWQRYSES